MQQSTGEIPSGLGGAAIERFSTSGVHAEKRLAYWNELNNETFTGLTVQAVESGSYSASLERLGVGSAKVAKARSCGSRILHTSDHIRRSPLDQNFIIHLQLQGHSVNEQAGREIDLAPGDLALCDTSRPYGLSFSGPASFLVLVLPAAKMRRRLPHLEDAVSLRVSRHTGRTRILTSLIEAIWVESSLVPDVRGNDDLQSPLLDLAAACLAPALTDQDCRAMRRVERDAFALADRNFGKFDYGVRDIAEQTGLSVRSVQKIFASRGTTVSSYILRKRLEWAARALERTDERITLIAFEAGFNEHAYFTRAFRSAFGVSPSEYRRQEANFPANRGR